MESTYTLPLQKVVQELALEVLYMPEDPMEVTRSDINRPGLPLAGYYEYFDPSRIQILGLMETYYLQTLPEEQKKARIYDFISRRPVCVVFARSIEPAPEFLEAAQVYEVPILRSERTTSNLDAAVVSYLSVALAPRITQHGVLVEVYGEGMLILGDSGVGKSEAAIELVKRGHRLIADDAVEIKRVSDKTLVGSAPELIKHYVELRGIGIIDVRRIFGMGAVKESERIDLIIKLENWVQGKLYDRLGMDTEYTDLMGLSIPTLTIPVRPGRNLAVIMEIAAMNHRQKKMGYNTALEIEKRILEQSEIGH
ncbi:MAG: HPr(Ser) kinase/phosphatase [Clostridiales bacterium]|nr:HPr(Ser) kinase/phosphatase [Clostridiales bacterium]